MGEGFIKYYKNLKKEYKIAFFATFIMALIAHFYKFANTLPNHDSVYNYYSDQNVLGSGRWALSAACGISSYYDLPWVNGLMSCLFIALTVVVIVKLFEIENPVLIAITGALLAVAPATTETLFFLFTADGYMIAMFLAALAVFFSRIEEKRTSRTILSAICVCVACGIYQAYVSFALVLAVCWFITILFDNKYTKQECMRWILRQIIIYISALVAYYVIWKLIMFLSGTAVNDYQGISEVGKISPYLLWHGAVSSVKTVIMYFLQWNVLEHGFTLYIVLNILFIIAMLIGMGVACVKSGIVKRKWALFLVVLCLIAVVPFACMWHFTSDSVGYRAMMLQSLSLLFVLTAILYEKWCSSITKNVLCVFLGVIIIHNTLIANISYFYMNLSYERSYAEGLEMVMEIHDLKDEYEFDEIIIIGDKLADVQWNEEKGLNAPSDRINILSSLLETSLLFNEEHTIPFLNATYGIELQKVGGEKKESILNNTRVENMPCWPSDGSMIVIDNVLVLKLSDKEG